MPRRREGADCGRAKAEERPGPRSPYAFLPWLILGAGAFSNLVQGDSPNPWLGGALLLAFNSLYVAVVFRAFDERARTSRTTLYLICALTVVTAIVSVGFGSSWLVFVPLLALALGTVLRGRGLGITLLVLSIAGSALAAVHGDAWEAVSIGYGTFLSGLVTSTILSLSETVTELRSTRQELARAAVERERLRFSRDLHDLLGHTLSVIVVKSEAARRLAPRDLDAALAQVGDIESVGRQALTEIREAVTGYRESSLVTELDRARDALASAGVEPVVRQSGPPLPAQTAVLLGWVVRESATNVVRHAGASECVFEVTVAGGRAVLEVSDDGRGCAQGPAGSGLKGLGERLAAAGGALTAGPGPRRGFRVRAELPYEEPEPAREKT
ncbi:histidine kinase [Streptomyces sp. NPDC049954]|uniref:histidine kinase n=1 Tax=Streptomyces sp. NPDC049954 TaxID=3155779 RepID=UPI003412A63C